MFFIKSEKNQIKIDLGTLLVAATDMDDEYFKNSVILIAAMSPDAVVGFIINRPLFVPLTELFDGLGGHLRTVKRRTFSGGPVAEGDLNMISFSTFGGKQIVPGIRLGGHWNTIEEMLDSDEYENRLFMGYASWGVAQLVDEITVGKSWLVYSDVSVQEVFDAIDDNQMQTSQQAVSVLETFLRH